MHSRCHREEAFRQALRRHEPYPRFKVEAERNAAAIAATCDSAASAGIVFLPDMPEARVLAQVCAVRTRAWMHAMQCRYNAVRVGIPRLADSLSSAHVTCICDG